MHKNCSLIRDESGAITVMMVILMAAFVGLLAIVIDLGHLQTVKNELQNSADAAALAGARYLMPLTGEGEPPWPMADPPPCGDAKQAAADTAYLNKAAGAGEEKNITIDPAEILTGVWDFIPVGTKAGTFTETACGSTTNAVKVTARMRADLSQGSVIMTFAKIFGINTVNPSAVAVAVVGNLTTLGEGPNRGYLAPNVNFIEKIYNGTYPKEGDPTLYPENKNWYLVFQPARGNLDWTNADNAGYALPQGYPGGDTPNPANVIPVIQDGMQDTMTADQTVLNLGNGEATPILGAIANAIAANGGELKITVPVVNSESFNHPETVVDFYTIVLTDVWKAGANKQHPFPQDFLDGTGDVQEQIKFVGVIQFHILKKETIGGEPGPAINNTVALNPKLVQ